MINSKEQKASRDKSEAKDRSERAASYAAKMGIENVAQPASSDVAQPKKSKDAAYYREYRKRPKTCPHCRKEL